MTVADQTGEKMDAATILAAEHRALGAGAPRCVKCDVPAPCPTMDVLADREWYRDGYTLLQQRLIPFTSPETTRIAIQSARDLIRERLRGRPRQ